eukprot:TRINITY_DN380_c2_g1_i4.p1 TRINITY_DN380_c2_g1~~TRINITY_DN380_c2_g1_i4.p1  ORF type:complete len:402 (-),score=83.48 TRINITY_DN380_c2_g1_i4:9-1214(-)
MRGEYSEGGEERGEREERERKRKRENKFGEWRQTGKCTKGGRKGGEAGKGRQLWQMQECNQSQNKTGLFARPVGLYHVGKSAHSGRGRGSRGRESGGGGGKFEGKRKKKRKKKSMWRKNWINQKSTFLSVMFARIASKNSMQMSMSSGRGAVMVMNGEPSGVVSRRGMSMTSQKDEEGAQAGKWGKKDMQKLVEARSCVSSCGSNQTLFGNVIRGNGLFAGVSMGVDGKIGSRMFSGVTVVKQSEGVEKEAGGEEHSRLDDVFAIKEEIAEEESELVGLYRYGLTEEDVAGYSDTVKTLVSLQFAPQKEINAYRVKKTMEKVQRDEGDTGSPEAQVANFTERIKYLAKHLETHKKDNHSRRGLVALVNKRRKMLKYLHGKSPERYLALIGELGLRDTFKAK